MKAAPERTSRGRIIAGWSAVALNTLVACVWALWGAIENFHEGWHARTLGANLLGMLLYLSPMLIVWAIGLLGWLRGWLGAGAWVVGGALGVWFIATRHTLFDPVALVMGGFGGGIGVLWWFGRPRPRWLALVVLAGAAPLTAVIAGAPHAWRVAHRHDDGDRGLWLVEGNGVALEWAPAGPGWPDDAVAWDEAVRRCAHLSEDGTRLMDEPENVWRLPTVDEAVRSLTRGGENAGGVWDAAAGRATYRRRPDKESPLWDPYTKIIYWWSAEEIDRDTAWRIVHNGLVTPMNKRGIGSMAFRAVREPR